nr:immunoglobulin light chain junction region [Macaca mulatta]MOX53283.1 immunoglobulin light chain junction region [Macaca mulatta]MOX53372.1 immunoglobulin light chain junction region [Macaca mulatta]MOX54308.1 immunoglobulin light chain junction region [Macaca mulatta]MOX54334.1 immunoglobulin light chain junction region [Macaca mulatta]
CQQYNEMLFTF